MLDGMRRDLEHQLVRLLEEAERPMRVEEMLPHLDPVLPTPNDLADVLAGIRVEREGSFYRRSTPVPTAQLFPGAAREEADVVVEILRGLAKTAGEGVTYPSLMRAAQRRGLPRDRVLDIVARLKQAGEAYTLGDDRLRLAKP